MMPIIALSVTEAELFAAVLCAQDMMYIWRILTCIGLIVELPMILEVDNKGAVDFCNGWSVGGRTRHIEVKQYFLRELKEMGFLKVVWLNGDDQTADIFTKNTPLSLFEKHGSKFFGIDEYCKAAKEPSEGDNVKSNVANGKEPVLVTIEMKKDYLFYKNVFEELM